MCQHLVLTHPVGPLHRDSHPVKFMLRQPSPELTRGLTRTKNQQLIHRADPRNHAVVILVQFRGVLPLLHIVRLLLQRFIRTTLQIPRPPWLPLRSRLKYNNRLRTSSPRTQNKCFPVIHPDANPIQIHDSASTARENCAGPARLLPD